MQLSLDQFERILSALRSDNSFNGGKEKRLRPRVGLRSPVSVVEHGVGSKGIRTMSTIRDVSRDGIGLQHCREMKIGRRFLVQLPADEGEFESFLCTVRRCEEITRDMYHIGATFIRVCDIGEKVSLKVVNAPTVELQKAKAEKNSDESARIRKAILG